METVQQLRRVLVTGASKGIGQAIALKLAQQGFFVVAHYRKDLSGVQKTLDIIRQGGHNGSLISFDISNQQECLQTLEQEVNKNGAFYGIVCNAGITADNAFPFLTTEDWSSVIHTNLDGFFNVLKPLITPLIGLRSGGRIVTISSVSGLVGNRGQVNYSAAKAGIIGATKALAIELAKRNITVNCVAPGLIDTEMTNLDESVLKQALAMIPMNRKGTVQEVASAVAFLMSDDASYITRQVISVNGGMF